MKPTVLLTGGFGNLGGRIAAALHTSGRWNLRLASRTHRNPPDWAPSAQIVYLDLLNSVGINEACRDTDVIIHLAALNDREALKNPENAEMISGHGTQLLAESATREGTKRFIFMSTAHVYGSPLSGIISETSPTDCSHPYATSHLSGERIIEQSHNVGDFLGIRLRCANGFGYPMDSSVNIWHVLVNDLCRQVATSGSIKLNSSGRQHRNFIPIKNICLAIEHFMTLEDSLIGNGLFNLGGPNSHSLLDMAKYIADRSQLILGIDPPISTSTQDATDTPLDLDFQINKLISTGFCATTNADSEIDQLLRMCKVIQA